MVDVLSFARELESQTDLMVRTPQYHLGSYTNIHSGVLHCCFSYILSGHQGWSSVSSICFLNYS